MKKTTIVISLFALIFSLCAFVGCQAESSKTETAGEERIASTRRFSLKAILASSKKVARCSATDATVLAN